MAKYRISWTTYPSSEAASSYSAKRANVQIWGSIFFLLAFFSIIWYIVGVTELFGQLDYIFYLKSLLAIVIMAWVIFYIIVVYNEMTDRRCKIIILEEAAAKMGITDVKSEVAKIRSRSRNFIWETAKGFFGGFLLLLLAGTGLIGCIKSIIMISHNNGGTIGLIIALVLFIAGAFFFWFVYVRSTLNINRTVKRFRK